RSQLTGRKSVRVIEACLRSQQSKLYHMGFRERISRNTLAHANETRDWRIFADFTRILIATACELYRHEPFGVELAETVYALDATTIDLCLSVFPWASSSAVTRAPSRCTPCSICGEAFRPMCM
ncbi:MAG: DUF4372 domain-containing protein, partial [Candidatus Acidiferrales bacterium]